MAIATFGAGCFWGVEEVFRTTEGVEATRVGYMGGNNDNPTYKQVCDKDTNHAEVVEVTFNDDTVSFEQLVQLFFSNHNPTQLNRQGADVGTQYRSVVFYHDDDQAKITTDMKAKLMAEDKFGGREIVTQIVPVEKFWEAEDYHQQYLQKRGLSSCHI